MMKRIVYIDNLRDEQIKEEMKSITPGCFVLALKISNSVEALTMLKYKKTVTMLVSKEGITSLLMRYLNEYELKESEYMKED